MPSSSLSPMTWSPGTVVPGTVYRIICPLGQGGMGEVYEVEHDLLGTRRALKVLAKHYAGRDDLAERLRVEARGLARLKHRNLVEVYDLGAAADGRIFFAMELLQGCTLRDILFQHGKLSASLAVHLIAQALDGLHAAHTAGLLHRDIKPDNVWVCPDSTVKLLDFGVAKAIDAWMPDQQITGAGMTVGTPRYMSPEQAAGAPLDARTDVYAAGLVLWEALMGRPAFEGDDPIELAELKMLTGVAPLLGSLPLSLCAAVETACEREPDDRQETAEEFAAALRSAIREISSAPTVPADVEPGSSSRSGRDPTPRTIPAMQASQGEPAQESATDSPRGGLPPLIGNSAADEPGATEIDPMRPSGPTGTDPVMGVAAFANPIDRDQPTRAAHQPNLGPSGTEILPAVSAAREPRPTVGPSQSAQFGRGTLNVRPSAPSQPVRSPRNWKVWAAAAMVFALPVVIASWVGVALLTDDHADRRFAPEPSASILSAATQEPDPAPPLSAALPPPLSSPAVASASVVPSPEEPSPNAVRRPPPKTVKRRPAKPVSSPTGAKRRPSPASGL